tara:strand:+ start:623 stop:1852 length:1230 start_codon:yes stop_codon:yes gene_type:complete
MIENFKIENKFKIFIFFNIFFVVFYLFIKHDVGNDSSISEWLINYKGGFTRRGFGGEIGIFLSKFLGLSLRQSIFLLQSLIHVSYLIIILNYLKNIKFNLFQIFALFAPIFILYPIAEIEVLGRKEMLLFLFFIISIYFCDKKYSPQILNYNIFFLFPILCLIWEQVVLFAPYFAILIIFKNNLKLLKKVILYLFIIFCPSIITFFIIFLNPLSEQGHQIMCSYLLNEFGEKCYMSANLLIKNTIYFDTWDVVHQNAKLEHYLRYLLIFLFGFLPLNLLIIQNSFKSKSNFINSNFSLLVIFSLLYLPSILLFIFGYDWGRWINISYTFTILLYFFLLKNNHISNKIYIKNSNLLRLFNKKTFIIPLFIIFAFGWNPKTVITGDVGTKPIYQIPRKAAKIFYNDYLKEN